MIEFTLKVKVLADDDVGDIQDLLNRMRADDRMVLATGYFELDVTEVTLCGSPRGRARKRE